MLKFGDLQLLERVASGGMAEVFRARQTGYQGFEKIVAVKRILPDHARNKKFKEMFLSEAKLTATLEHPNIAHVYNNGEMNGYLFLVMEFIDGKNLRSVLEKAERKSMRIPVDVTCFIISEVLKGLDYAHKRVHENTKQALNLVHRDVSPQNIMLSYDGQVKLVDFGIAKATSSSESTQAGSLKGKFGYMSPEQARGETLDSRSDIFSAGIVMWEMLTQRRLFAHENDLRTLDKVKLCEVPRPSEVIPSVPSAIERIVLKALQKNPKDRYQSCHEFYADLMRSFNSKFPDFIPTDFNLFMRDFFKEEISGEKIKRKNLEEEIKSEEFKLSELTKEDTVVSSSGEDPTHSDFAEEKNNKKDAVTLAPEEKQAEGLVIRKHFPIFPDKKIPKEEIPKILVVPEVIQPIRVLREESPYASAKKYKNSAPALPTYAPHSEKRLVFFALALILLGLGLFVMMKAPTELIKKLASDNKAVAPAPKVEVAKIEEAKALPQREPDSTLFQWEPYAKEVYGLVDIKTFPNADIILINGKKLVNYKNEAYKTPLNKLQLNPGKYKLEFKNTGFGVSDSTEIEVVMGKSLKIESFLKSPKKK